MQAGGIYLVAALFLPPLVINAVIGLIRHYEFQFGPVLDYFSS